MSQLNKLDGLAFETDRNGVIRDVGEINWNVFASRNGAPELTADRVIGRNLFDFIDGEQVRGALKGILERISHDPNWAWVLPFRCDAPDYHRNICQTLRPVFQDGVCTGYAFHSFYQTAHQRPRIDLYDFKKLRSMANDTRNLPVVKMCSWCQRVQYDPFGDDIWLHPEVYYAKGGQSDVKLSHGICNDCLETRLDPLPIDDVEV